MLSKAKQKLIQSLWKKKYRDQEGLFIAEGHKLVVDLLNTALKCRVLIATEEWFNTNASSPVPCECLCASVDEIKKISALKSPPPVLAVFEQPGYTLEPAQLKSELSLFLDDVQDPGNLGTIIRMADWFGIQTVVCSKGCADVYNPKTVQSTMGAIARVQLHYCDGEAFFQSLSPHNIPVYGTFLDGDNMYHCEMKSSGVIVMGNEGQGISKGIEKFIRTRLYIPNYPADKASSESLNVAVATAIVCAEFRRRNA